MSGFLGSNVPTFEIRDTLGETSDMLIRNQSIGESLADTLGNNAVALLRGHGNVVVANSIQLAVFRAYYTEGNAKLQADAMRMSFGMGAGDLRAGLARLANPEARMVLEGFHFHLSGYAVEPRVQAVRELLPWVHEARRMGLSARMLDIGGGLPIRYVDTAAYSAFLAAQDGAHYRSGKVPTSFYPYGGPVDACMWMEQLLCSACTEGMTVAQALNAAG